MMVALMVAKVELNLESMMVAKKAVLLVVLMAIEMDVMKVEK